MRADLEAAMAAVIASRGASVRFAEDPGHFGETFSLSPAELAMLVEMGDDLTSLTSAFVSKRRSTLRWNARRTLELLGREGEVLLDDFVEDHPQSDSFRRDAADFGGYVVDRTARRPQNEVVDRIIAEMARFEHHRSDSFWDASDRLDAPGPGATGGTDTGSVVLVAGANVAHFGVDMRLPYRKTVNPWSLLPDDPCDLLFFHCRRRAQLRTLRLRGPEAAVVEQMKAGQPASLEELREAAPDGVDVGHLVRTLSWEEAVEWE